MTDSSPTLRDSLGLLATRRFGTFWIASLLSNIGTWAQQVAEPWLILSLSGSAFLVGADGFALNAPAWALTLVGGVLADRFDRRRVILGFQSLQALCPATLMVLVFAGVARPWQIIALSVVVGITDALSMPSFQSIVPSIVDPARLGSAYALNSTQFNLSRILGPAIAGVLLAQVGVLACFGINTLSYVPFILVALWILPRGGRQAPPSDASPRPAAFAGLREILRHRELQNALGISLVTSLFCGPLVTFCPVLVRDAFHADASRFGGALSAFGVGGVAGALGLLALEGRLSRRWLCSGCALAYGAAVIGAAQSPSFLLLMALLVAGGASMTMSNTSVNTLLQTRSRDNLRGQAASLYMLAMRGGLAAGSLLTGLATSAWGIRPVLLANGAAAIAVQLLLARRWRAI